MSIMIPAAICFLIIFVMFNHRFYLIFCYQAMSQKIALQRKGNLPEGGESHWLILFVGKDFIFRTQVQIR